VADPVQTHERKEATPAAAGPALHAPVTGPLAGVPNRLLARALAGGGPTVARVAALTGRAIQRAPQRPTGPARGKAPVLSTKFGRPANAAEARRLIDSWFDGAIAAVGGATAAGTGASHAAEIAATDVEELKAAKAEEKDALVNLMKGRPEAGLRDWWDQFRGYVATKQRELDIEFGHNVQIAADGAQTSLGSYEDALKGLPLDALWTSTDLVTIRRGGRRGSIGGDTDATTHEITMYDAGMAGTDYRSGCAALSGLKTPMQAIRHEIGHLVDARLSPKERDGLFVDVLDWRMYRIQNLTQGGNERLRRAKAKDTAPLNYTDAYVDKPFAELMAELGVKEDAEVMAFVASFGDPSADDPSKPARARSFVDRKGRRYWRQAYMLHSVGHPAELPTGDPSAFDYALTSPGEYVPELYAYAINRPAFLAGAISKKQMTWWKETVFKVPADPAELKTQVKPPANVEAQFLADAEKLFTWEQLDARLGELTKAAAAAPVAVP
jgi:hypothetical protein